MQVFRLRHYLYHLLFSGNAHSIHSPFVFDFYNKAISDTGSFGWIGPIEDRRQELLSSQQTITVKDYGAGSGKLKGSQRKIREMAKWHEKPAPQARLLYRIAAFHAPKSILDLGTSFGLTTSYLSLACPEATLLTFEGCPESAAIAEATFRKTGVNNQTLVLGNIDMTLKPALEKIGQVDFAFFDANHRYAPTIRYFEWILEKSHDGTLLVFDDIYWSLDMKKAWQEIAKHDQTGIAIDLYYLGLVFLRKKQPQQYFRLRL